MMLSDDIVHNADCDAPDDEQLPSTPPSPDALDGADLKGSRKREREVSIEPATPKAIEEVASAETKDRRTPATKKNRLQLDSTAEEPETPPPSPKKTSPPVELSTSPPHETKVRQIRDRVRSLNWDDNSPLKGESLQTDSDLSSLKEGSQSEEQDIEGLETIASQNVVEITPSEASSPANHLDESPSIDEPSALSARLESDPEDQDKKLKRKLGDRAVSGGEDVASKLSLESAKRARDDAEQDDNPRDKKRPTPPPEEQSSTHEVLSIEPSAAAGGAPPVAAPQPKAGGFLSYASTSSPFSKTKGPSMFGGKPSPSPFASASGNGNGNLASNSLSSFAASTSPPSTSSTTSPTGTKRTGFEAFASASSPFTSASRSKSPTGFGARNSATGFNRSKSPPRTSRALGAISAFASYSGSTSPFAVPPVKKQRQDQESGSEAGDGEKETRPRRETTLRNGSSTEASEDEGDRQTSFGERLRAGKSDDEAGTAGSEDDDARVTITEQDLQTGEEDEETVFQVRGKLYQLSKQNQWRERGTGLLKLNVRRFDGVGARLVMRKEAVFALLLNVTLFKGMKCTLAQDPRYVRFSSIEDGTTVHYNLRVANAKVATDLLEEINANIPADDPTAV